MDNVSKPNIIRFLTLKSETFFVDTSFTIRQFMEKADFHKFTVVPILDKDGIFVGTVSEGDVLRYIKNAENFDVKQAEGTYIMDIARYRSYVSAKVDADIDDIFRLLTAQNFVPLVDDRGAFIGIIKRRSVMEYFFELAKEQETPND